MTIADIRAALNEKLDSYLVSIGENETLTEGDNVTITDALAGVLETVNLVHSYPSNPKP